MVSFTTGHDKPTLHTPMLSYTIIPFLPIFANPPPNRPPLQLGMGEYVLTCQSIIFWLLIVLMIQFWLSPYYDLIVMFSGCPGEHMGWCIIRHTRTESTFVQRSSVPCIPRIILWIPQPYTTLWFLPTWSHPRVGLDRQQNVKEKYRSIAVWGSSSVVDRGKCDTSVSFPF